MKIYPVVIALGLVVFEAHADSSTLDAAIGGGIGGAAGAAIGNEVGGRDAAGDALTVAERLFLDGRASEIVDGIGGMFWPAVPPPPAPPPQRHPACRTHPNASAPSSLVQRRLP